MKNVWFSFLLCFFCSYAFSQYAVSIKNMKYSNGTTISSGQPINFSGSSINFTFTVRIDSPLPLEGSATFGTIEVFVKRVGHSQPDSLTPPLATVMGPAYPGSYTENPVGQIQLNASDFSATGDYLYVVYKPNNGGSYNSQNWPITKSQSTNPITNYGICCNQTVVEGSVAATIIGSSPLGGSGSYSYRWKKGVNGGMMTVISGATAKDYNPGIITEETYFIRETSSSGASTVTSGTVIIKIDNCPESINVTSPVTASGSTSTIQAASTIVAINNIQPSATANYHAGNSVILSDGFYGQAGSAFRGYIEGCAISSFTSVDADSLSNGRTVVLSEIFTISPNPATENVTVASNSNMVRINVTSLGGFTVLDSAVKGNSYTLDVSNYKKGIYVVTVTTDTGETEIKKLVKS